MSIDDYEKAKAEKKAAIAAMMRKGDAPANVVDESAFASMKLGGDAAPENQFGLANAGGAKAKRERERKEKEKKIVATGFKTAPAVAVAAPAAPAAPAASAAVVAVVRDGGRGLESGGDDLLLLVFALALALRLGGAVGEAKLVLRRGVAAELHGGERGLVHHLGGGVALLHHRRDRRLLLSLGLLEVVDGHLVDGLLGLGLGRVGVGVAALRRRLRLVAGLAPAALAGAAAVGTLVAEVRRDTVRGRRE